MGVREELKDGDLGTEGGCVRLAAAAAGRAANLGDAANRERRGQAAAGTKPAPPMPLRPPGPLAFSSNPNPTDRSREPHETLGVLLHVFSSLA